MCDFCDLLVMVPADQLARFARVASGFSGPEHGPDVCSVAKPELDHFAVVSIYTVHFLAGLFDHFDDPAAADLGHHSTGHGDGVGCNVH